MMPTADQLLLATLAYADIFSYPLTVDELRVWFPLIPRRRMNVNVLVSQKLIHHVDPYMVLAGRISFISLRHRREQAAAEKWRIVSRHLWWVCYVPTLRLVGVTGSLSMNNADATDDIDLFIITAPGTLWSTRLVVTAIAQLLGTRRHPQETAVGNKLCFNMFVTEDAMRTPKMEQDFYASHEVLQLIPVWERSGTHEKFLRANDWVKKFLPNAWREKYQVSGVRYQVPRNSKVFHLEFVIWILKFAELPARVIQLWYMQRHRTNEVITDRVLRFHPRDARDWIKKAYAKRLARYGLPLDKIFYAS